MRFLDEGSSWLSECLLPYSPIRRYITIRKRGLNCHTLEDGRRKTNEEDMEKAAHAKRENRNAKLASKRKFPTFSSTSQSNTLLVISNISRLPLQSFCKFRRFFSIKQHFGMCFVDLFRKNRKNCV